jgi:ABC-type branched-subunit amino acid transport system substrate-binding protein
MEEVPVQRPRRRAHAHGTRVARYAPLVVLALAGCNQMLGLDELSAAPADASIGDGDGSLPREDSGASRDGAVSRADAGVLDAGEILLSDGAVVQGCTSHAACSEALAQDGKPVAAWCRPSDGTCVPLLSEDCTTLTGLVDGVVPDGAILLGSLFSLTGSQAQTNLVRQQSATLAVEQLDDLGGIPGAGDGLARRRLVMVSCDEAVNPTRAAQKLVDELGVVAIVGPNTSQDTIALTQTVSAKGGTLMITPSAVASSIADLIDDGLTWSVVPSDVQRAPLMIAQVQALAAARTDDADPDAGAPPPIKVGVIYRNDALGIGSNVALNELRINGAKITDAVNGSAVKRTPYDPAAADQNAIVDEYREFAPDIIVMAGLAEAITKIMVPLEETWSAPRRPEYVLIDSLKVPDLLTAAQQSGSLRARVRGTGITPGAESRPYYDSFKTAFNTRYGTALAELTSGMGPAYDATFAIAYALTLTRDEAPTGHAVAKGLSALGVPGSERLGIQHPGNTQRALRLLAGGTSITPIGTFSPLGWDGQGAIVGGTLEIWCVGTLGGRASYGSSGLTYDLETQTSAGAFAPCAAR